MENINLGSVQAPYWEQTITLAAQEHRKIQYVTDNFELKSADRNGALKVSFAGTMIQTPFSEGMGYRLTEPVQFVELWNDSNAPLTVDFVVGIGDIKDNRLTVSGTISALSEQKAYGDIKAGTKTVAATDTLDIASNSTVSITVLTGTLTFVAAVAGVDFDNLELGAGQTLDFSTTQDFTLTINGNGKYNYFKGVY